MVLVKGIMINVESESGRKYTRNVSFFKHRKGEKVQQQQTQKKKSKQQCGKKREEITERSYPKRNRQPLNR